MTHGFCIPHRSMWKESPQLNLIVWAYFPIMARNDALANEHTITQLSKNYQFSANFIYVTEKLTVGHCFWSYTQPQTAPVLKPSQDRGCAHVHHAKFCT